MDGTTDLLLHWIANEKEVFRFNADIWVEYEIVITDSGFAIRDPTGRMITEDTCSGFYLRKPYFLDEDRERPLGGDIETWNQHQIQGIIDGLYSICHRKGQVRLVERLADRRIPKVLQMRVAKNFFIVPEWSISINKKAPSVKEPLVCKSLRSSFTANYQSLFTSPIKLSEIEDGHTWFLQSLVEADSDVTIVYVSGHQFAFARARESGESLDYRESLQGQDEGWIPYKLTEDMASSIDIYMRTLGLEFGRLDFLLRDAELYFLEVNPNGQFAWLDPYNKTGLLSFIANAVAA